MDDSTRGASQTPKLYEHPGAKISVVCKYLGFIKAKDKSATKTKLYMTKAMYNYFGNHTLTKQSNPSTINVFFIIE